MLFVKSIDTSGSDTMYKAVYIGNEPRIANTINELKEYKIKYVICQKEKIKDELQLTNYSVLYVSSKQSVFNAISAIIDEIDFAIMYNFGIIIPQEVINIISIYNFHPGDLRNNRGSSPIHWAILLNMQKTMMSLYKITANIDIGELVCEHKVKVFEYDVPKTLKARLEGEIPSMLLYLAEYCKSENKGQAITEGVYRQRIKPEDYTITSDDTEQIIKAKIRSQYEYNGAILKKDDKIIRVCSFEEYLSYK